MSGIRWSDLRVCGIPVTIDPAQGRDAELVARDGDTLIVNLQVEDGKLVGATGHIDGPAPGEFRCVSCAAVAYSFVADRGPPPQWTWDAETDTWRCGMCSEVSA